MTVGADQAKAIVLQLYDCSYLTIATERDLFILRITYRKKIKYIIQIHDNSNRTTQTLTALEYESGYFDANVTSFTNYQCPTSASTNIVCGFGIVSDHSLSSVPK